MKDLNKYEELALLSPYGKIIYSIIKSRWKFFLDKLNEESIYSSYKGIGYKGSLDDLGHLIMYEAIYGFGIQHWTYSQAQDTVNEHSGVKNFTPKESYVVNIQSKYPYEYVLFDIWLDNELIRFSRIIKLNYPDD